jgi:hypothetical protein
VQQQQGQGQQHEAAAGRGLGAGLLCSGPAAGLALPQPAIRIASAFVLVATGVIAGLNAVRLL